MIRLAGYCYLLGLLYSLPVMAQNREVLERRGYSLTFLSNDSTLDPRLRTRMIRTFFDVYPVLVKEFNEDACRHVLFDLDTAFRGVGEAYGCNVHYGAAWLRRYPSDIDLVTHEIMHVVQHYPHYEPSWVTEGIADYARYIYGVDNSGAGWTLPAYKPEQHYTHGYRVTARFFLWLERHVKPGIIKSIDQAMRAGTYSAQCWPEQTGRTIDDLWTEYAGSNATLSADRN